MPASPPNQNYAEQPVHTVLSCYRSEDEEKAEESATKKRQHDGDAGDSTVALSSMERSNKKPRWRDQNFRCAPAPALPCLDRACWLRLSRLDRPRVSLRTHAILL